MTTPEESPQAEDTAGAQSSEQQSEDPDADPQMMDTATKRNEAAAEGAG